MPELSKLDFLHLSDMDLQHVLWAMNGRALASIHYKTGGMAYIQRSLTCVWARTHLLPDGVPVAGADAHQRGPRLLLRRQSGVARPRKRRPAGQEREQHRTRRPYVRRCLAEFRCLAFVEPRVNDLCREYMQKSLQFVQGICACAHMRYKALIRDGGSRVAAWT